MSNKQIIKCTFCGGSGRHPYYLKSSCPICKGKGENEVIGDVQRCKYCKGSGCKSTTTLTCYYCGGLGITYSHRPNSVIRVQYSDKDVIEKVVEETLKKYKLIGLRFVRQKIAAIKRIPVNGVLREEKEMKADVKPISGVRKESAKPINHAVASLRNVNKKEQGAGSTTVRQRDFGKTVDLLVKIKKEGGGKR